MQFYSGEISDITVEQLIDCYMSKVSEYSEMCDDPTSMLVYYIAKKNLKQAIQIELLLSRVETLERKRFSAIN